ncbi:MAG: hypothetical protein FWF53_07165 [Candidatus Azobacteroides sp.]|nr:hypothetical protein [Candidatus Azobacteroides sp.]
MDTVETIEEKKELSFQKGWFKVRQCDVPAVRIKLMSAFGVTTRVGFLNRLNGNVNHTEEERNAVEEIFNSYGITEIWGKP